MDHRQMPPWPKDLKAICTEECAQVGEPSCWQADEFAGSVGRDYGRICNDCWMAWKKQK